jgi:hypothetical protein
MFRGCGSRGGGLRGLDLSVLRTALSKNGFKPWKWSTLWAAAWMSGCALTPFDETGMRCSSDRPCGDAYDCVSAVCAAKPSGGGLGQGTLVARGAQWKFLDNGTTPSGWNTEAFDDQAWAVGKGPFGYGTAQAVTSIGFGSNEAAKYITTYFRISFTVADASAVSSLGLKLLRDGGAVLWLNGTEILRDNLPTGPLTPFTEGVEHVTGADDSAYLDRTSSALLLRSGRNVLAVEVHQDDAASSDMVFDLEVIGR